MNILHGVVGSRRENYGPSFSLYLFIESTHIKRLFSGQPEQALFLLAVPLIESRARYNTSFEMGRRAVYCLPRPSKQHRTAQQAECADAAQSAGAGGDTPAGKKAVYLGRRAPLSGGRQTQLLNHPAPKPHEQPLPNRTGGKKYPATFIAFDCLYYDE